MADVPLKPLLGRLDHACTRALETAAGLCMSRGNYEITIEHVLSVLIDDSDTDLPHILHHYAVDQGRFAKALTAHLEQLRSGNGGRPVFSPMLVEWVRDAWLIASLELGLAQVRSGVLFMALLGNRQRFIAGDYDPLLESILIADLKAQYPKIIANSREEASFAKAESAGDSGSGGALPKGESAIAQFCTNFTQRAREGRIDPVFGRDREIRQMVDILARRRKNNPICVGEPGVGKSAVVEGLALRIVEGDVSESLKDCEVIGLDLALLQAGASIKGEFEKRLKNVLDEVKASVKPMVLFIDEAHTLIGAGGSAGTGDAANLLKPALARGELKTVAATTWGEYKKYFEKDPALARRFQLVKLDEPDVPTTITMLRGLRANYEAAHGVVIRDDALAVAAEMGARYISARQHPDKGIDLVDTAAARVKVAMAAKPPALQDAERRIQDLERARDGIGRDRAAGSAVDEERLAEIEADITSTAERARDLEVRWRAEKAAADAVIALRRRITEAGEAASDEDRSELSAALLRLEDLQGEDPQVFIEVTPQVVARVVADWTGIPVGNMVKDQAAALLTFEGEMGKRIKGQDHVLELVGTGIRSAKAGLGNPDQPMGIFLFVGPSGVGKTETATAVADLLFGGEDFMTTIAMSEFQEKHAVSRLVGTTAGYVGYGEGGQLTEAVRQRPYSVVLLDEVEKADLEVMNLFYQVFDKGTLSDGEGRQVNFRNTVMFLTSNLATDAITEACANGARPDPEELVARIRPILSAHFKPALLARMTIVPFYTMDPDTLLGITRLKLGKLVKRCRQAQKLELTYSDRVVESIAERCTEVESGARNVDHIINGTLLPQLSRRLLEHLSQGDQLKTIGIDVADGAFTYSFA